MIILLRSVTIQFRRLFRHFLYYKLRQSNFIKKCDRLLLQSASGITKCDSYYRVRRNNVVLLQLLELRSEATTDGVRSKKVFLKISQNSQENN